MGKKSIHRIIYLQAKLLILLSRKVNPALLILAAALVGIVAFGRS